MKIEWRNVHVEFNGGKVIALTGVSGNAEQGKMLALMGSTGSGKSTLLNSLSGRGMITKGSVRFGQEGWVWSKALKRHVGFVEQDDIVYSNLTVRQSLSISAQLRLPQEWPREKILSRVEEVIKILRLDKCADTLIGDAMNRGVSGGERKRVCIAQELLTSPKVLCLDEPTSGLDSSTALLVVELLESLALEQAITVVASIHQPSSQVYAAFHDLIVLHLGKTVYRGDAGNISKTFADLGYPCPHGFNISDWFIDVIVSEKWRPDDKALLETRFGSKSLPGFKVKAVQKTEPRSHAYNQSYMRQVCLLVEREWLMVKDQLWSTPNFITHAGNAIVIGFMYFRTGHAEEDIFPRFTACFFLIMMWLFFPLISAGGVLPVYKLQLRKELAVGAYPLSAWFFVRTSMVMLQEYVWPVFNIPIIYWMAGINDSFPAFIGIYLCISLTHLMFHSMGLFIATSTSEAYSLTVSMLVITIMFGYSGVFVPVDQIPPAFQWVPVVNPMVYAFGLVNLLAFDSDTTYSCNPTGEGSNFPEVCASPGYITNEDIFEYFNIDNLTYGLCFTVCIVLTLVLRVGSFFFFYREMLPEIKVTEELDLGRPSEDFQALGGTPTTVNGNASFNNSANDSEKEFNASASVRRFSPSNLKDVVSSADTQQNTGVLS